MSDDRYCCVNKIEMNQLCTKCYNAFFSDPEFQIQMFDDYGLEPINPSSMSSAVCECGGGAIADNTHSPWCPKFRKD